MQHLFLEDDRYTQEARDIADEAGRMLHPLYVLARQNGYSFRDVSSIIHGIVTELECEAVLG